MIKTAEWILSEEVRNPGDWCVKRPNVEPGGWCFEYANEFYPDIDDTAMVLLGLKKVSLDHHSGAAEAKDRAINWIMAMQGKDGGWASFDVDNNHQILCCIPFADHNAMIDPSTADITARILEMLAAYGYDRSHQQVQKAINYLLKEQEPDGSWFGRWGVNYIYGTWQVLRGLTAIGLPIDHPSIRRGAQWLLRHQNSDGGWGETCLTYDQPSEKGRGMSTASQTAWGVMGLISAGYLGNPAIEQGIDFLIRTQTEEGTWEEKQWTGTGFPRVFYLRYHMYRHAFPLWALGMYVWYMKSSDARSQDTVSGRAAV
jgi:squalene-hopene/tetraprenyl-beta-curcumene cyclase